MFGTFGKGVDDREMRNVFVVAAVRCGDILQCVKVCTPRIRYAAWIGQVVFVHLFYVGGIAAEKIGIALVGLIHRICIAHFLR
ncbi:hypothetical protein D3C72_1775160 [compost metagenome]